MSRGANQKFKFPYLMRIMLEKTDDDHALTMTQIMAELEKYGVTAERKSVYADFQDMTEHFGVEILKEKKGHETYYHVSSREFELAEVKLLVDAIQSSKFITQGKSRKLITKIKKLVSEHQGKTLQRQVFMDDRVKAMNESVFYNVDEVYTAINENRKIRFKYYKWNLDKKLVPRHGGEWFTLSPWALTWVDENYYMVAYDEWEGKIKNYRVDKMMHISVTDEKREGAAAFKDYDMARLSKSTFGMYGGPKKKVKIHFENSMCGIFLDQFGKEDISFIPVDKDHSEFWVNVNISPQFFGWIFALSPGAKLVAPDDVVSELKAFAEAFLKNMN